MRRGIIVKKPVKRTFSGMSLDASLMSLRIDHSFERDLEDILRHQVDLDNLALSACAPRRREELPRLDLPDVVLFPTSAPDDRGDKNTAGPPPKATVTHVVHPGECLWTISKAYSVPISTIMTKNDLDREIILVGQELKIPIGELSEDILSTGTITTDSRGRQVFDMGRSAVHAPRIGSDAYLWPVKGPCWISSNFGRRFHPIYRKYKFHNGIDIAGRHGTPIIATADGEVVFSGYKAYSGKVVYVKHPERDLVTIYAHCSKLLVKKGERVRAGQMIAKMGRTGRVTGIHLHFAVMKGKKYQNPVKYIGKNENTRLSRDENVVVLGG